MQGRRLGLQAEVVLPSDLAGDDVEEIDGGLDDPAALVAHQVVVMMVPLHQVEHRRPWVEVNWSDHAELGQSFEGPIDGGLVEVGVGAAHGLDDVGGGEVMVAAREHRLDDQPA